MNLKQLTAALLPPESRENILGDLEERGFRLGEVISVTVTARFTAFLRDWVGPVPNLSSADDARLELRIERLHQSARISNCNVIAVLAGRVFGWWAIGLWILLLLVLPVFPNPAGDARERHRAMLRYRQNCLMAFLLLLQPGPDFRHGDLVIPLVALLINGALIVLRTRRVKQELANVRATA